MSWVSKGLKKIKHNLKKHVIGNKGWDFLNKTTNVLSLGLKDPILDAYERNKDYINPILGGVALGLITGGIGGAAFGLTGIGGTTVAGAAASGAASGAVGGGIAGGTAAYQQDKTEEAIKEQEKALKEYQMQQERLARASALQNAAASPTEQSALSFMGYSQRGSQIKRTQVSRNKKVGGSSTTLG